MIDIIHDQLTDRHRLELIARSGIDPGVIARRGYRSVTTEEARAAGFAACQARPGLLIPRFTTAGAPGTPHLKPDQPRVVDGKIIKYESPHGVPQHPDAHPDLWPVLRDPSVPLAFTEGAKKADSLTSQGVPCIELPGVHGFLRNRLIVPDLDDIDLAGREVRVIFDSDVTRKESVAEALLRFCAALHRRGAHVAVVYLPEGPDGAKVGVDDYLIAGHTIADLIALSTPWTGQGPGVWFHDPHAGQDKDAVIAEQAATISALLGAIKNPNLKRAELIVMASVIPQAQAKRTRGEADAAGYVRLSAAEVSGDYRPVPAPGERVAATNPDGTRPRMARDRVRPTIKAATESGLLRATPIPVTRSHANGNTYQDTDYLVAPAPSLAEALNPWATYRPEEPVARKPRTAPTPCPECGEVHPIHRTVEATDTCGGCGTIVAQRVISQRTITPEPAPESTSDKLSEVRAQGSASAHIRIVRKNIGGESQGQATSPQGVEPASDKSSGAPIPPRVHAALAVASHPPTQDDGRAARSAITEDLAAIAQARGRSPVPKPGAAPLPGLSAPTPLDPWTDVAFGGRQP